MRRTLKMEQILAEESRLRTVARKLVRDDEAAETLVKDTLLLTCRTRDGFNHEKSVRGWTTSILIRGYFASRCRSDRRIRADGTRQPALRPGARPFERSVRPVRIQPSRAAGTAGLGSLLRFHSMQRAAT